MLRIANTRTRWRERRDSGKTGERQRAANECNFDGIDVNWFDYWYEDRIEHATWKIHVLICAAFDTRIAHSASQHLISYHHDEGRLLLLLLSFRVCDIFVFITFTNGIVKLFNINRSNWIKADPIHFDSMAIHIVTLLNLRFGRYVFGKTNLCDSASCLDSKSMEEKKQQQRHTMSEQGRKVAANEKQHTVCQTICIICFIEMLPLLYLLPFIFMEMFDKTNWMQSTKIETERFPHIESR